MKTNGCIAFGGAVNLAAADDKLIRVRHPLHLDPEPLMLASIMAKKVAVGSTHVLIDIPVGPEAKTKSKSAAIHLGNMFKSLGRRFKQKVKVVITDGTQPIGNGIGPVLEAVDVLKLLKQTNDRPRDLEEKAIFLASEMMAMVGRENARSLCEHILRSGQAYKKMREIIREQGGNPNVTPSDLRTSRIRHEIKAEKSGRVSYISNKAISGMALACGAPLDKGAGLYLYKHVGDSVKKGDHLITLFAKSPDRVRNALNIIKTSEAISY
jgi:AMP phosphorylase